MNIFVLKLFCFLLINDKTIKPEIKKKKIFFFFAASLLDMDPKARDYLFLMVI